MKAKKTGKQTFKLCGLGLACPTVKIYKNSVTITDDHGGKVKMKRSEFEMMQTIKE